MKHRGIDIWFRQVEEEHFCVTSTDVVEARKSNDLLSEMKKGHSKRQRNSLYGHISKKFGDLDVHIVCNGSYDQTSTRILCNDIYDQKDEVHGNSNFE